MCTRPSVALKGTSGPATAMVTGVYASSGTPASAGDTIRAARKEMSDASARYVMRRIFDRPAGAVNTGVARGLGLLAVTLLLLASPSPVRGQENFEIQVYGSETMAPGTTMIELHTNSALRGSTRK